MRHLLLSAALALLLFPNPAEACMNDSQVAKREQEFATAYMRESAAAPADTGIAWVAIACLVGGTLLVATTMWWRGRKPSRRPVPA